MTLRSFGALSAVGVVVIVAGSAATAQEKTVQRSFASGGTVNLDLSAGEYTIIPSATDTIRITARANRKVEPDEVSIRININAAGTRADIEVDGPSNNGVDVEIQLPRRVNLTTDLSAGELKIRGIEGSKDISASAGELDVELGDRNRYRRVNASVKIGELHAPRFDVDKEGFFRSFEWNGKGSDNVRVRLLVGELTLN